MPVTEIVIPQTDVSDETVLISKWLVADGAKIDAGQIILAFEASKAAVEFEAPAAGWLRIGAAQGSTVPIGAVVAWIAATEDELPKQADATARAAGGTATNVRASKKALELAAAHGIDLGALGVTGIVTEKHVQQAIDRGKAGGRPTSPPRKAAPRGEPRPVTEEPAGPSKTTEASRVQTAVARQVLHSLQTRAHAFVLGRYEVDATQQWLERSLEKKKVMIPFGDVVVFHVARVLRQFPRFNACLLGDTIHEYEQVNVAFTVDIGGRLYTPVIHDADKLSLSEINQLMLKRKMEIMRGSPGGSSLAGGTFTVSILDTPSLLYQLPIINRAQGAILGVGARMREFVPREDNSPRVAHIAGLCLSYDHCLLNGADAAKFLSAMGERLGHDPEAPDTAPV
jgi:pyruvate/2-oxoglutarate dehydrogenase complex dihydrolipoamide acyltransferase (E2) component